jgi:hypothetical protein
MSFLWNDIGEEDGIAALGDGFQGGGADDQALSETDFATGRNNSPNRSSSRRMEKS